MNIARVSRSLSPDVRVPARTPPSGALCAVTGVRRHTQNTHHAPIAHGNDVSESDRIESDTCYILYLLSIWLGCGLIDTCETELFAR